MFKAGLETVNIFSDFDFGFGYRYLFFLILNRFRLPVLVFFDFGIDFGF